MDCNSINKFVLLLQKSTVESQMCSILVISTDISVVYLDDVRLETTIFG